MRFFFITTLSLLFSSLHFFPSLLRFSFLFFFLFSLFSLLLRPLLHFYHSFCFYFYFFFFFSSSSFFFLFSFFFFISISKSVSSFPSPLFFLLVFLCFLSAYFLFLALIKTYLIKRCTHRDMGGEYRAVAQELEGEIQTALLCPNLAVCAVLLDVLTRRVLR